MKRSSEEEGIIYDFQSQNLKGLKHKGQGPNLVLAEVEMWISGMLLRKVDWTQWLEIDG